jgi:hypothetical protein
MARPRWHANLPPLPTRSLVSRTWDRAVALWATLNLVLVVFDITYLPLRNFWKLRQLTVLPPVPGLTAEPLVLELRFIPAELTEWVDPIKGIEPHRETQDWLRAFDQLDASMTAGKGSPPGEAQQRLLQRQRELTDELIDTDPFAPTGASGTLERIKNRMRDRAGLESSKQSSALLFSPGWQENHSWEEERQFWREEVVPLMDTNYWRSIDENGRPTDHFWQVDLLFFQSVFLFDILLRTVRLRRRVPGMGWGKALLRRWIDLPLLLPFLRWLRVFPVTERLQTSGLVNLEPLRAVVSRGVVSLLAVELFEVLALQLVDGFQQLIRSRRWPTRIRALRSHQTISSTDERELVELLRLWGPLLLVEVAPRLAPELRGVLGHTLQQSLERVVAPGPLRQIQPLLRMEEGLSRQLASGMVESLLDLSRTTGQRLGRRDDQQLELMQRCIDRFWEELAAALESGTALERSQQLLCAFLEDVKRTYVSQINRAGIEGLMDELDLLTVKGPESGPPPVPPA